MPTFHDPVADGDEAREALRGLVHATRVFDDPAHTYDDTAPLGASLDTPF